MLPGQAAPGMRTLHGHVPAAVSRLQAIGTVPASANLYLAIGLPLRNQAGLSGLLQQLYDPSSPIYHRYLTPEQFTAQFGPTEQDYQKVIDFAKAHGLTVVNTHPNRVVLDVTGAAADIEKAFHVKLRKYRHPTEHRDFFAPDTDPTVDVSLPILHISGLNDFSLPHPVSKMRPAGQTAAAVPAAGSGPTGSYWGNDFRRAYVPGSTLTGAGQNVALVQFDGFFASDIATYEAQIGLTTNVPQLVVVPIDGGVPTPGGGVGEVSLDIEMVVSMAPGVSKIYVYEAPNPSPWVDILSRMANDNVAKQLSSSWGGGQQPNPVAEQIFQQMALQGQTFYQASGDSDAFNVASGNPIFFPSDSPHITTVGGTTLTMTGSGAAYASETVWNWGIEFGLDGVGSSGGISSIYAIPSWQTNINFAASHGSTTMRNVPDVALTGDNVWVIFGGGQTGAFGGTSCDAPLWAGFTALINQQAVGTGHAPVGFINTAVYAIATGPNYANCFHDTTTGNNTWSGSPSQFFAVPNYDLCTGLGTPNGTNLINALAASVNPVTHLSPPPPPYGSTFAALNGSNPNGNWSLFIQDDSMFDSGVISNGWVLTLTTANPVGVAADNQLLMTASTNNITVGDTVTFVLTVTNYGPTTTTNVLVSDSMPVSFTLDTNNSTNTVGSLARSGSTVNWNIITLAPNAGGRATLVMQANSAGYFNNAAIVSATTPDPNPDDDSVSANILVGSVTPPVMSGVVGTNGTFRFSITSLPGQTNVVYASTNLVNWVPLQTNVGSFTFTNLITTPYPVRFYRDSVTGP